MIALVIWFWWRAPHSAIKQEAEKLRPELRITSLNINDISETKISATSKTVLRNNLPIDVNINHLDYTIYIDSAKVIEDAYSKPIKIRSSDTTVISLPMEIMYKKLGAVLKHFENDKVDSANYSMVAKFNVDVPIAGEKDFTMHFNKRLPALRLPKAKMGSIDVGKLGFKNTKLDMVVHLKNPNVFPIKIKDGQYKFSIDKDENVMQGQLEHIVTIPAHSSDAVAMHVDMKTMKVPKLGWKILFDKKDTHYKMNFSCRLMSENRMFNNSKMAINMEGTLKDLADAVKPAK